MLGKILYLPFYWLGFIWLKINLAQISVKIWPRNSFYFNRVVPFKSDIDLTLFFSKKLQTYELNKIRKSHILLKNLVPLFCELNVYDSESNLEYINPFELSRDPVLKAIIDIHLKPLLAHKIVFIQKMLLADKKNLIKNPTARIKKWRGHFQDCSILNFPEKNFNLNSLLDIIFKEVFLSEEVAYRDFLAKYLALELNSHEKINKFYLTHLSDLKYFILTVPAQWIGAAMATGRMDEDLKVIKNFSDIEREILMNHISWEHWGIESQKHINFDDPTTRPHLQNLDKIANAIND